MQQTPTYCRSIDKLTGLTEYTKHCFWLNASYVKDEIYLKTKNLNDSKN